MKTTTALRTLLVFALLSVFGAGTATAQASYFDSDWPSANIIAIENRFPATVLGMVPDVASLPGAGIPAPGDRYIVADQGEIYECTDPAAPTWDTETLYPGALIRATAFGDAVAIIYSGEVGGDHFYGPLSTVCGANEVAIADGAGGITCGAPVPAAHAASHAAGAADEVEIVDLGSGAALLGVVAIADGAGALGYGSAEDLRSAAALGQTIVGDGADGLAVGSVDGQYVSAGAGSDVDTLHSETLAALAPTLAADELTILDDGNADAVTLQMVGGRVRMGVLSTAATEFTFASDVLGDIYAVRDDGVAGAADLHVVLQGDGSWRLEVLEAEVTALGFADGDVLYTPAAFVERLIPVYVVTAYSGDEAALNANAGGDALVADFTGAGHAGAQVIQVSTTAAQRPPELPTITP